MQVTTRKAKRGESPRVTLTDDDGRDWVVLCGWFARCTNDATGTVSHPILGDVPTCDRCAKIASR